ncbi:hypothetical protein [Roseivivax isoporae]|uniref:Uncharacterized protein n=1 Tax=Roseivivax isoporae LMG 25204 TaxID=1449351 RepID=X7F962_9RHOB|nr:hypothetical protein [Roseivivax isoporae]ETX29345.1 hypothetical protein RISW2_01360 [Roseivivax isoporae LMG 25204]
MNYQMSAAERAPQPGGVADMPALGAMSSYRLPQPGARPLVFSGSELAMAMSFTPELPYWYELNVYRTREQTFVLAIRQFFQSEEQTDIVKAWAFDSLPDLFDRLETYDAGADVRTPHLDLERSAPAELAAAAMDLKSRVIAARTHFAGLVGEFFAQIDAAGNGPV